jgi:signal transduction histidine kinase
VVTVAAGGWALPARPAGRGLVRGLAVVCSVAAAELALLHGLPDGYQGWLQLLLVTVTVTAGVLLGRLPGQRANGRLLVASAVLAVLTDLSGLHVARVNTVELGYVLEPAPVLPLAALLLRWPASRLRPAAHGFVVVLSVVTVGGRVLDSLTWDARWVGPPPPVAWLHGPADQALHEGLVRPLVHGSAAVASGVFLVLLLRHWRAQHRLDRVELLPLALAAAVAAVAAGAQEAEHALGRATTWVQDSAQVGRLLLPLSFVVVAVAHRYARAQVAAVVLDVTAGADVEATLREALGDPGLQLLYLVDGEAVGPDGTPAAVAPGGLEVPVHDLDGTPLARLVVDPSLARHRGLLDAAVGATALALANARLRAVALAQLSDVQASRRRIATAGLEARARLERDLHDGAQQRLLAVSASLSRARLVDGAQAAAALDETRDELRRAMADLRDLARGVHPALLSTGGLALALAEVASGCAVPVRLDVPERRWPPDVEATAWFVVCEALTNTSRYAPLSSARVRVVQEPGALLLEAADDGPGGADPAGHGLQGLRDRVAALGGTLQVSSPPGCGTTLRARLPCG